MSDVEPEKDKVPAGDEPSEDTEISSDKKETTKENKDTKVKDEKKQSDPAVHVKLSKKMLWLLGVLGVLCVAAILIWQFRWYKPVVDRYNQGSVEIKVKEDNKYVIEDAKLLVDGKTYTTNKDGKVSITKIVAGTYPVTIDKPGYVSANYTLKVQRKSNPLVVYSLSKVPEKIFSVKGKVQDYVSNRPLSDVQVTLRNKTIVTASDGSFTFEQIVPGSYSLTFAKSGYNTKEQQVVIENGDLVVDSASLVPSGQIVFVSNRDGKRYLYASAFDGSNSHPFIDAPQNGEDFGLQVAPGGKSYIFSSTRGKITDTYGEELVQLHIVGEDGKNVRKLSDDVERMFSPIWSANGGWLYASGYTTPKLDTRTYKLFNTSSNQVIDIGEEVAQSAFSPDSNLFAYQTFTRKEKPSTVPGQPAQTVSVNQLKLLNIQTGERKVLAEREQYLNEVQFASDGKTVLYETIVDNAKHRYSVTVDGTPTEQEVPVPLVQRRRLVLSPNGSHYVFVEERDGKKDVFMVDKNQKNEVRLTNTGSVNDQFAPRWDENGRYIIYAIKREAENALYIVSTEGGDSKKITDYYAENRYDYGFGY